MRHHLIRALVLAVVSVVVAAVSPSAMAADKVRVGKAVPFAWTFTPLDVGTEVGIFAKHGLELEVPSFAGDARLQQGHINLDKAVIGRVYDEQIKIFTSDGRFDPKALVVLRKSLVEMGLLQQVPDDSAMFTTRFVPVKY
jgi:hypothetical protein